MTRTTAELRQYLALEKLFNNDFKDTSGNGNHGTPIDVEWKPTTRGMKPHLLMNTSGIVIANSDSLQIPDSHTVSCWIKIPKYVAASTVIQRAPSSKYNFSLDQASNKYRYALWDGTHLPIVYSNTEIQENVWVNVTLVRDISISKILIYINGEYDNKTTDTTVGNVITGDSTTNIDDISIVDNMLIYSIALTATEILNLYEETKGEYGVMPAEHSFTHNPDDVIDVSGAVGAWGTAKESTTKLVDLSGNGNIADIHGAMPAEGFIQGRRFTAANSNYLDCGNDSSLDLTDALTISGLVKAPDTATFRGIIAKKTGVEWKVKGYSLNFHTAGLINFVLNDKESISASSFDDDKLHLIICTWENGSVLKIFVDGQEVSYHTQETLSNDIISSTDNLKIGIYHDSSYIDSIIIITHLGNIVWSTDEIEYYSNTFARLPFWSVNYTDYPDNVAEYTDNLPYSSSIISSGTFKVDDDKLQCVSAGTMTYSASYKFDGSEYIKVEIGGVEYAGTGTITQGNTTVSVAQGSNKITIEMGTGDTIDGDGIDIQFREEV